MYKASKKLTLVVYEDQRPTRCFEFRKSSAKIFLGGISLVFLLSLVLIFIVISYLRNVTVAIKEQGPTIEKKFNQEIAMLLLDKKNMQNNIQELVDFNHSLVAKLKAAKPPENFLPLVSSPQGSRDLTSQNQLSIDSFTIGLNTLEARPVVTFNLTNLHEKKVSGFLFVIIKNSGNFSIYPDNNPHGKVSFMSSFDTGESFSVSHLRPVKATFNLSVQKNSVSFVEILLFSREGDLILRKTLGPIRI